LSWQQLYRSLKRKLRVRARNVLDLTARQRELFITATEKLREAFIRDKIPERELLEAEEWIGEFNRLVSTLKEGGVLRDVILTRELRSFVEDPRAHLRKKLFNYTFELLTGVRGPMSYERTCEAALTTSLRTNMRTLYQTWVFLALLKHLTSGGGRMVYPQHGFLSVERSGMQRLGMIPPNCIVETIRGFVSLFIEVPRPICWEDGGDLSRVWKLYTALRPDFMAYGGPVMDIVDLERNPPIKRPNVVIEVKELEDWPKRVRELRGRLSEPISAEDWRFLWIKGLVEGLGRTIGAEGVRVRVGRRTYSMRVGEPELLRVYWSIYQPDEMVLISRAKVPQEVRSELEDFCRVYDGVGFEVDALKEVAEQVEKHASGDGLDTLTAVARELGLRRFDRRRLHRCLVELVKRHKDEFTKLLGG